MANRVKTGFRWVRNSFAPNSTSPPIEILPIADDYATALYIGDPVILISTGYINAAVAGSTAYGVFVGCERYYDGTAIRKGGKYPASQSYDTNFERQTMARIIPAFGQEFELVTDDLGATYDTYAEHLAFIGENCEWVAGTPTDDTSGARLDISTHNTTNTLSLRLKALSKWPDVDYAALGVPYIVTFNLVQTPQGGSTTGT